MSFLENVRAFARLFKIPLSKFEGEGVEHAVHVVLALAIQDGWDPLEACIHSWSGEDLVSKEVSALLEALPPCQDPVSELTDQDLALWSELSTIARTNGSGAMEALGKAATLRLIAKKVSQDPAWPLLLQNLPVFSVFEWEKLPETLRSLLSQGGDERWFCLTSETTGWWPEALVERLAGDDAPPKILFPGEWVGWVVTK